MTSDKFIPFRSLDATKRAQLGQLIDLANQGAGSDYDATITRKGRFITYKSEDGSKNVYEVKGLTTIPDHKNLKRSVNLWLFESGKESWLPQATVVATNAAGLVAAFNHY